MKLTKKEEKSLETILNKLKNLRKDTFGLEGSVLDTAVMRTNELLLLKGRSGHIDKTRARQILQTLFDINNLYFPPPKQLTKYRTIRKSMIIAEALISRRSTPCN